MINKILIILIVYCLSFSLYGSPQFPGLTNAQALAGAKEYISIYSSYARAISKHMGRALAVANHMTYPYGEENMGSFPGLSLGIGTGLSLANTDAIKNESDKDVTSAAMPAVLPALAMSLNLGVPINKKWSLRISMMPTVTISLPKSAATNNVGGSIGMGLFKGKMSYHLLEGGLLKPGLALSGYLSWSGGSLDLTSDQMTTTNRPFSGSTGASGTVTDFTYIAKTQTKWNYYGLGSEVKLWTNLMFFFPYIGYGLGLQTGRFNTKVNLDGVISLNTGTAYTSTAKLQIEESAAVPLLLQRIFIGFEIKVFLLRVGAEIHTDITNQIAGISVGASLQF